MESVEEPWKPMKLYYCFVKTCKNSSPNTPGKLFFPVPFANRKAWCLAAGRSDVPTSYIVICEDHLQPECDVKNYQKWNSGNCRPRLKTEVPSKLLEMNLFQPGVASHFEQVSEHSLMQEKGILCVPDTRTTGIQVNIEMFDLGVNTVITKKCTTTHIKIEEPSTDDEILPSTQGNSVSVSEQETDTDSTSIENIAKSTNYRTFMAVINKKPYEYIGIPQSFFWLVDLISKDTNLPKLHLITVLYKIRQGDPFKKIADLFSISETTLWRIFPCVLDVLATICKEFIYWPSTTSIKRNLPLSFRTKKEYANTQSIINCFEIKVKKKPNPVQQSLTWSRYKSHNTVKYLISATPDGFINFISKGYAGRISDLKIVEESGYLNFVKPNTTILADRGFKHLEPLLNSKSVRLLHPPSVFSNKNMTKSEAIEAKTIASLRIHIERVIRRVRLFKFLKAHSTINNKLINCTDNAGIVACGLINLKSPIKRKQ